MSRGIPLLDLYRRSRLRRARLTARERGLQQTLEYRPASVVIKPIIADVRVGMPAHRRCEATHLANHTENCSDIDWPPCEAVITVECVPSSADVSARAVTILSPEMAKKPLVSLEVNVPLNCEPSDIVTLAVAITAPAGALSGIVGFAGERVIAVGIAVP